MDKDPRLEISKLIGEPINYQHKVPVALEAICNIDTVDAGEKLWSYTSVDASLDTIIAVDATDGKIKVIKVNPLGDTEIALSPFNSKLEYVLVNDVLNSPDTKVLGRKKAAIVRGMDKRELKLVLDGIIAGTNTPNNASVQVRDAQSGEDLYDVIIAMKHLIEDYGDGYVLLAGTTVKEKIDTYRKENASTFNYDVKLIEELKSIGVDVVKVFGKVETTDGGGEVSLLDPKKMILLAKNSTVAEGKPIWFIRRKINAEIAKQMGADVDSAQRALIVGQVPQVIDFSGVSSNVLGYSIYGMEQITVVIPNPKVIVVCDATLAVA